MSKMIQNAISATETPFISCHNVLELISNAIVSSAFCENTCHYRQSAAEGNIKSKMPNRGWNLIKNQDKKPVTAVKFHQIGG